MKGFRSGDRAWVNGSVIPREALHLPVGDAGFVLGATVTEQLRTFRGELFLPVPHRDRLARSLAAVGIDAGVPLDHVLAAAAEIARFNHRHLSTATTTGMPGDLGVVIFVTPGDQPSQHEGTPGRPLVVVHTFPLAFATWANAYEEGVALRSVSVRQVPADCWPIHAKVRSRLHYFLADREAAALEPGARAVVCHADGRVSETTTANIVVVRGRSLHTPPPADALGGVSLGFARGLAEAAGLAWEERSLTAADLAEADEILLTSTPNCILPATRFDGVFVGFGRPGPVCRTLLEAWSRSVGLDIPTQARGCAIP